MGQYWKVVNLDKREYINPLKLGSGLKLWEQLANPGVGQALVILLAAMPKQRGGGDLQPDPVIGRWAGDRVVFVGDYSQDEDMPGVPDFGKLYGLTTDPKYLDAEAEVKAEDLYKDVTDDVCTVIERELHGKFVGDGWRRFEKKA
jgi:hypothetical protein